MSTVSNSPAEDPRLLLSEPFRAVHFVFGLFHPDVPALPGRALVGSLAALGFSDAGSRGILLRLRRNGFLESRRTGRRAIYALSPRSLVLLGEISGRATQDPPPWDGTFDALIVQVPPDRRAFREQLRRHAAYAGFGALVPGLLIAPYPASRAALGALLAMAPDDALVSSARLTPDPASAASLAEGAWDLAARAAILRDEVARMAAAALAAEASPPDGAAALTLLWRSIGPFFEVLSAIPPLPVELLPRDWPLAQARAAFMELAGIVALPARRYVERLAAEAG